MKLQNEFPQKVRNMYFDLWDCAICGRNGVGRGGLELHHIKGRESDSALNSALVCNSCHVHLNHNDREEEELMLQTARFLVRNDYPFNSCDLRFYNKYRNIYDKYEKDGRIRK